MTSTSVSVIGDREYINLLKALAATKGISLAKLTRDALDNAYGNELETFVAFFDASSVAQKPQKMRKRNIKNTEAQS